MTHTRRNFSKETRRLAYKRSNGICECHLLAKRKIPGFDDIEGCGVKLGPGNTFYEHIQCDQLSGMNDLSNCATLVRTCWRKKTDTYDLPTIAKSNRVRDLARGIRNHQFRPMAGTKASGISRPMNPHREPYYRDSGRPLFERKG